jgi:hypothetical protein
MLGFSEDEIAYFIAFIGILSCIAQVNNLFFFFVVYLLKNLFSLDTSIGMFTKIFWGKRDNHGWIIFSNCSVSCIWNCNIKLV